MNEDSTRSNTRPAAGSDASSRMHSLVEVAQKTGIPMPILLRYKREHPERIPSSGTGSQQRFPETAFEAFLKIQREEEAAGQDLPRRGGFGLLSLPKLRRRSLAEDEESGASEEVPQAPAAASSPPAPAAPADGDRPGAGGARPRTGGLLKLTEISERLGIPYPTAARYASQHADRIPHEGQGRNRRFPPEALDVFQQIRRESKPGRPPKKKARQGGDAPAPAAEARSWRAAPAPRRPPAPVDAPAGPTAMPGRRTTPTDLGELARRISALERAQADLGDEVRRLLDDVRRPVTVVAAKA